MSTPRHLRALEPPLLTIDEVAELLRVTVGTIYLASRRAPEVWGVRKLGRALRFYRPAIEALIHGTTHAEGFLKRRRPPGT